MTTIPDVCRDPRALRDAFSSYPSGVVALCAVDGGKPVGMAVSSFTTVSLEPPLVSVCIQNTSSTWPKLNASPHIGVSVLAEYQDQVCRSLSSKTGDRFAGIEYLTSPQGAIFIQGAALHLECMVHALVEAGDHQIILMRIEGVQVHPGISPLIFHTSGFRQLKAS